MNILPQLTQDDALFCIQSKQLLLAQLQANAMAQQLAAAKARITELEAHLAPAKEPAGAAPEAAAEPAAEAPIEAAAPRRAPKAA